MPEVVITVEEAPVPDVVEVNTGAIGAPGPTGPQGPPGGAMVDGWWDYSTATTPPPAAGQVRTTPDPPIVGAAMTVYLSKTDREGLQYHGGTMASGDDLKLRGSAGAVQHVIVSTFTDNGAYATVQGTLESSTGSIAKNADVEVTLIRAPLAGPTGPAGPAGATGPTGPSGLPGVVRVNHGSNTATARPAGAAMVLWVGSVQPANRNESTDLIAWVP